MPQLSSTNPSSKNRTASYLGDIVARRQEIVDKWFDSQLDDVIDELWEPKVENVLKASGNGSKIR